MNDIVSDEVLFSFGIISDIQYADIDDRQNYQKTKVRHYRKVLNVVKLAVDTWNSQNKNSQSFVLNLGDIIDVANSYSGTSREALEKVLCEFSRFNGDIHHIWGNHELYNFLRSDLLNSELATSPCKRKSYYSFCPHKDFCFIVLDTYEVSVYGYEDDHPMLKQAKRLLQGKNPNEDKTSQEGMKGMEKRFVDYNGGISDSQLMWLKQKLVEAQNNNQWVIITGHQPLDPESCFDRYSVSWNYDDILAVMHQYTGVVVYFSGHDHNGGYVQDSQGVHHMTFPAAVESEEGSGNFGILDVYNNRIELHGSGNVPNMTLHFKSHNEYKHLL